MVPMARSTKLHAVCSDTNAPTITVMPVMMRNTFIAVFPCVMNRMFVSP